MEVRSSLPAIVFRFAAFALVFWIAWAAAASTLTGDQALQTEVERYIRARAPGVVTAVELPSLQGFESAWTADGDVEVKLSTNPRENFVGSVPVTLSVLSDGKEVKRGVVTARVHAEEQVLVASRALDRGAMVHEEDVVWVAKDAARLGRGLAESPEELVGQRTTRAVREGAVWRTTWVAPTQLVHRGDLVRLVFERGGLRIDGLGKARQHGRPGDMIRVWNVDSRREVVGRITEAGAVNVAR